MILLVASFARSQTETAFLEAWRRVETSAPTQRAAAAREASDCFLAMPGASERERNLLAGIEATAMAERWSVVLDLVADLPADAPRPRTVAAAHLRAVLEQQGLAAFVAMAKQQLRVSQPATHDVLVAVEAKVAGLAEKAVRSGDIANGRFVFEELAAVQPTAAYRLANLGLCLRQFGDSAGALRAYERARAEAPADLDIANDHGLSLRASGQLVAALQAFQRSQELDLLRAPEQRGRGPAITNLVHLVAVEAKVAVADPLPAAAAALAVRPDATMLKRLVLDVGLDRLAASPTAPQKPVR